MRNYWNDYKIEIAEVALLYFNLPTREKRISKNYQCAPLDLYVKEIQNNH